ncbi:hypothetical protein BLOT_004091 [Blomia tropicalis]|nr:hypothetical protein BLOT_004091 [Blomia tropicalis]
MLMRSPKPNGRRMRRYCVYVYRNITTKLEQQHQQQQQQQQQQKTTHQNLDRIIRSLSALWAVDRLEVPPSLPSEVFRGTCMHQYRCE